MAQANISRMLIGPYGLHVILGTVLVLFVAFLLVFNLTTFF